MIDILEEIIKNTDNKAISIRSNKTLLGKDQDAAIYSGISMSGKKKCKIFKVILLKLLKSMFRDVFITKYNKKN